MLILFEGVWWYLVGDPVRRAGDSVHDSRQSGYGPRRDVSGAGVDSDNSDVKYRRKPFGEWFTRLVR